jgi:putative CocE/NonD family hydrolase
MRRLAFVLVIITLALLVCGCAPDEGRPGQSPGAVSEFGKYEGYSEPADGEWVRVSEYLPMRDGVRLAVDIIRPAVDGEAVETPLPVVWSHRRYGRAAEVEGQLVTVVDADPTIETLIRHGYVVVAVDVRGTGASFGQWEMGYSEVESRDAYEVTEWLAAQPWCDGNVGMFGASYLGIDQLMAASTSPPHLKALFPSMIGLDLYDLVFPGGVYRTPAVPAYVQGIQRRDLEIPGVRVDGDESGTLLAEAMEDHRQNRYLDWENARHRDSQNGTVWGRNNPVMVLREISASDIPTYIWGGWYDLYARDMFQWYANLEQPKKLAVGVWAHRAGALNGQERIEFQTAEQLRWFDYWLKGIDNGIMDEPPIHYAVQLGGEEWSWSAADAWPVPGMEQATYHFSEGPTGTVASVNDSRLVWGVAPGPEGRDTYVVDYSTTSGLTSRWYLGTQTSYPDMRENDAKGLTYTTDPLDEDLLVTGHPVVTLHVTSTATDGDFHVHLEEVDTAGVSHYVTEGLLRASHRALAEPPFDNMGLPYHRSHETDMEPMSEDEPATLVFDLLPTSNLFDAGNRIRVTVTCADRDNAEVLAFSPPPQVTVFRNRAFPSNIVLPVVVSRR